MAFEHDRLHDLVRALGQRLQDRGEAFDLVVVGGGALLLLGAIQRPTEDLDVLARVERGAYVSGRPFPEPLVEAVREIAELFDVDAEWLNPGPTDLLDFGLPKGFATRTAVLRHGGLTLRVCSREDQIALKLYAAVDRGPQSKHFSDLRALEPTSDELRAAAAWATTHDTSEAFADQLRQALAALGVDDG